MRKVNLKHALMYERTKIKHMSLTADSSPNIRKKLTPEHIYFQTVDDFCHPFHMTKGC